MSGLEKFQASEAWRANFKKFLFMERKPDVQKASTVTESQRYSLDIGEDLKNIIKQKQKQKTVQINTNEIINIANVTTETTNKENMDCHEGAAYGKDETFKALEKICDKTVSDPNGTSDESFEALERMCNKTASDPNSTLFQYLHSDRKEQVLAEAKKRTTDGVVLNARNREDQLIMKINDCTLLDDIEAPSRMWENTICGDTILQTSPVKMVGLLRPSTIIEEAPDDSTNSDISSHTSFRTATKCVQSDVSSSAYETAHNSMEATIVELGPLSNKCDEENFTNISVDLIDLEKTFCLVRCSPASSMLEQRSIKEKGNVENELDDSIIEILSDDEVEDDKNIDISNKNYDTHSFDESQDDDKENCVDTQESSEKSMHFNDTMEEVEYMLKKGMEYIAAEADAKKNADKIKEPITQVKNSPMRNTKAVKNLSPAAKAKSSIYTTPVNKTPLTKGVNSTSKRFDFDMRPFPKLDIFVKPTVHARTKELTSKQQKFSHIISPVGTYMKKTGHAPLMSSMNYKTKDYFNSSAVLELEHESRLYKPQFATLSDGTEATGFHKLPGFSSGAKRALPKKAYISSDLKHIVDERTPITIPGGKKIQKYLDNAMMPAVLRHEGKFKIANSLNTAPSSSSGAYSKLPLKVSDTNSSVTQSTPVPRRNNASLADLSLMSGDVSMYTIMDAQKF